MKRILKYMTITLFAFVIAILGIDRMPQIIVSVAITLGSVYFIRQTVAKDMRIIILSLFLATFLIQLIISLSIYNQTLDTKYYGFSYMGDDYVYGDFGTTVADLWRRGIFQPLKNLIYYSLVGTTSEIQKYQLYNALIFYLFGSCGGQILLVLNCFFHAAIIIPVYFICKDLNVKNKVTTFVFFLFLFWPSTFFWSLFNFKESSILFALFVVFGLFMQIRKNPGFMNVTSLLIFLSILYCLKKYLTIVSILTFFYFFIFWKWRYKKITSLIFLLIFISMQLFRDTFSLLYAWMVALPEVFSNIRYAVIGSRTEYFTNLLTPTCSRMLLYFPYSLLASLILPFLLRPFTLSHIVVNIESIIWWILLPFFLNGLWISMKTEFKKTFLMLLTFFYWIIILALTQGNMGTLVRQKAIIYYIGFIFIGLSMDRILDSMVNKRSSVEKEGDFTQ